MRCQFYHAIALGALLAAGCGRPVADTPAPAPAPTAAPGASQTSAASPATATSDGVRRGKELIEAIRAAAGGAKLTAIRGIEADGTSMMSVVDGVRTLSVRAMFPEFYRQEEIPTKPGGLGVAIGLGLGRMGWMLGARFGGGNITDPQAMQNALVLQEMDIRKRNLLDDSEWARIAAATLVLWTTHDPTNPVDEGRRIASMIPNARFVVMEHCGHWPQPRRAGLGSHDVSAGARECTRARQGRSRTCASRPVDDRAD